MASSAADLNYTSFLNPEPPEDEEDLQEIFVNRRQEMEYAEDRLLSAVARPRKRVLAIWGRARVGKSHFLRELLRQPHVRDEFQCVVRLVVGQGSDDLVVLREALREIYTHLLSCGDGLVERALQPLGNLYAAYGPAIQGTAAQIKISAKDKVVSSLQQAVEGNVKLGMKLSGVIPALAGMEVSGEIAGKVTRSDAYSKEQERAHEVVIQPLTSPSLRTLIGLAQDLVRLCMPQWKTLLVIDDFDLLNRNREDTPNPGPLLRELFQLAQVDGLFVLTTAREDTISSLDKSFLEVAKIGPLSDPADLRLIYDRHVARFHEGKPLFREAFVSAAIENCDRRPGLFLEILDLAYRRTRDLAAQLDYKDYMAGLWEEFASGSPECAQLIRQALDVEGHSLEEKNAALVRSSSLSRFVLEEYTMTNRVVLKPYIASYLKSIR